MFDKTILQTQQEETLAIANHSTLNRMQYIYAEHVALPIW